MSKANYARFCLFATLEAKAVQKLRFHGVARHQKER